MRSPAAPAPSTSAMPWLPGLLLTTFVIGTDDFIIAGILPEISADLGVSEAAAGQLVTVFSLVYAVSAPVLAVATAALPRKRLLVGGLALFALVNLATTFAPSYAVLMGMRILAALVAATVSPAAFALAGGLAPSGHTGRAIGTVAAGLTVSLVVGVPLGSWVGGTYGWPATFVLVAALSALAAVVTALTLPGLPGAPETAVRERVRVLRRPAVLSCVLGTTIGATSGFMPYIFIAPVVGGVSSGASHLVPVAIGIYGVAGAVGTVVGGRLNDRWGTDRALLTLLAVLILSILGLAAAGVAFDGRVPFGVLALGMVLWGAAGWAYNPPMNARALQLAGPAGTEAIALNTSGLYVGIAVAGIVGGAALTVGGGVAVLAGAGTVGLVNLGVMTLAVRRYPSALSGERAR